MTAKPESQAREQIDRQLTDTGWLVQDRGALGTGIAGGVVALSAGSAVGLAPGIAIADLLMLVVCGVALTFVARLPEAGKPSGA